MRAILEGLAEAMTGGRYTRSLWSWKHELRSPTIEPRFLEQPGGF